MPTETRRPFDVEEIRREVMSMKRPAGTRYVAVDGDPTDPGRVYAFRGPCRFDAASFGWHPVDPAEPDPVWIGQVRAHTVTPAVARRLRFPVQEEPHG